MLWPWAVFSCQCRRGESAGTGMRGWAPSTRDGALRSTGSPLRRYVRSALIAPRGDGVVEVFHARFTEYAYPMHVHDAWTLLIVDDGAVRYDLDRHEHGTPHDTVSLLPPHVPHNGAPATPGGFRKRVLYLDGRHLADGLIGAAVDRPDLRDPLLRRRVGQVHAAL